MRQPGRVAEHIGRAPSCSIDCVPHVKTIVLSGESDLRAIAPILRLGAFDYLPKPYDPVQLIGSVRRATESARLARTTKPLNSRSIRAWPSSSA